MTLGLNATFEGIALAYADGRLEDIAACFEAPLAVYTGTEIQLHTTPEEVFDMVKAMVETAASNGVETMVPEICGTRPAEGNRVPITVAWRYLDKAGNEIMTCEATYYCRKRRNGGVFIEMVEAHKLDPAKNFAAHETQLQSS